ncbi:2-oxoacid:acceptor oxidoreductase subunit alpha [Sulfidibacter corallicola]|uniref:2-oxoacid:acceptor oxidoreductase subunit alpha n=1 Tax=Sulfidibacter corallicola TaxID=2818388 RepID=A0A8A4TT02_SULCO|nr:2-oxoacid:acceptor oxidoreductase subunit alpha [Sulfidibacter corallicola]QTD53086.1 2-oxoacid:acceptor oxidoreductase subunit alpha [Sulfidibacter corallicola]
MSEAVQTRRTLASATIRFAGDSGDGMQLTGTQFTNTSATLGNDISTFPDFPAEIRAPAGTVPGVSGFQIRFASEDIHTPGDRPDVLVAMNPAALKANLDELPNGALLIINQDSFNKSGLKKAEYVTNPLEDDSLSKYRVVLVPLSSLTERAVEEAGLNKKAAERCKNFFALGIMYYLYDRPLEQSLEWIAKKFANKEDIQKANQLALKAGYHYADTAEIFSDTYRVPQAKLDQGTYRGLTGNAALAMGMVAAGQIAKKPLFYGSYPITPASDVLHELAKLRHFGVRTFQAEDEIAAIGAAIGAAFGGALASTGTSGPGICLKSEAMGLAVMTELPLVILNVQRAGPSTGMPTKTEQSDLLQVIWGRNGDSPLPVIAPATPGECFTMALEACRIAVNYMTPVVLLSDGYLANGAEPWKVPSLDSLPEIKISHEVDPESFQPYERDPETLARPWAVPGQVGLEHRIGGLEKQDIKGNVSYDPANHQRMTDLRTQKIEGITKTIPDLEVYGDPEADTLVLGWGGTYGSLLTAINQMNSEGHKVAAAHFRYLNPFPPNTGEVIQRYKKILVCELNNGQLDVLIKSRFVRQTEPLLKVKGKPFQVSELTEFIKKHLADDQA